MGNHRCMEKDHWVALRTLADGLRKAGAINDDRGELPTRIVSDGARRWVDLDGPMVAIGELRAQGRWRDRPLEEGGPMVRMDVVAAAALGLAAPSVTPRSDPLAVPAGPAGRVVEDEPAPEPGPSPSAAEAGRRSGGQVDAAMRHRASPAEGAARRLRWYHDVPEDAIQPRGRRIPFLAEPDPYALRYWGKLPDDSLDERSPASGCWADYEALGVVRPGGREQLVVTDWGTGGIGGALVNLSAAHVVARAAAAMRSGAAVDTLVTIELPPVGRGSAPVAVVAYFGQQGRDASNRPIGCCASFVASSDDAAWWRQASLEDPMAVPQMLMGSPLGVALRRRGVELDRPDAVGFATLGPEVVRGMAVGEPDHRLLLGVERWWIDRSVAVAEAGRRGTLDPSCGVVTQQRSPAPGAGRAPRAERRSRPEHGGRSL